MDHYKLNVEETKAMIPPAHPHLFVTVCIATLMAMIAVSSASLAQPLVLEEDVSGLQASVTAAAGLSEQTREELLKQLDNTRQQIEARDTFNARVEQFRALMSSSEQRAEQFNLKLETARANGDAAEKLLPEDATEQEILGQITLLSAERQALGDRRTQLLQETDQLPSRRAELQQRLVTLQQQNEESAAVASASTLEQQVALALSTARRQAAEAERQALELEVLSEPARSRVNAAERAWLGYAIDRADARLEQLNKALEAARGSATARQLQTTSELQSQLVDQDPRLQQFAQQNHVLARQLLDLTLSNDTARQRGQRLQSELESIEQDSLLMHRRLQVAGRKEVLGRVMITRLDNLPDTSLMKRQIDERNTFIADTSMTQIDVEEDFRAINERQDYLDSLFPDMGEWQPQTIQLANTLVDQRTELLEENLLSLGTLLHRLLENNEQAVQLVNATETFHKFLLGNLLWVRNLNYLDVDALQQQLALTLSASAWLALPQQLLSGYEAQPWSTALLALLLLSLLLRWRLRPVYIRMLRKPVLISGVTLWHMVAGLILSALIVLPWPLLLYTMGVILAAADPVTEFSEALSPALGFTAGILYILLLTRLIASKHGVGRRFLKWDARTLESLRKELNWAGPIFCLVMLVDVFSFHLKVVVSGGPLGALATIAIAASIILLGLRLLGQEQFNVNRLLVVSLRVMIVVAAAVIAMQLMGLTFAADIYLVALIRSVIILGLIKLVADLLQRWLLILRARLERKARSEQRTLNDGMTPLPEDEGLVDVPSLSEAHTKLLSLARFLAAGAALFIIWSPSLPAFTLFDSVTLWQVTDSTDPTGGLRAITLFDLSLGAIILVVTALITKNLPSISEVFMREWFNMSAGARYATSILLQYLVIAVGGSLFLGTIGWEWGKVQWLVAAMGVGIGFGLQEIVANFISGIIILFERPVRVGDIISAGGAEGTVKKINPRATIIETFDRKEHLIPNKELITGQVINWTLSDAAVRVIIPVGIAYGSDVRQALALLIEAAQESENVLGDPPPKASFEDFGDNALVLWLRCYVAEDRVATWTDLRAVINDKFAEAGIAISFPQRDVHLDTVEPLQVEVRHLGTGTGPDSGAIPDR